MEKAGTAQATGTNRAFFYVQAELSLLLLNKDRGSQHVSSTARSPWDGGVGGVAKGSAVTFCPYPDPICCVPELGLFVSYEPL